MPGHTGISGEQPQGAVSGVGDPRERQAFLRVYPLGTEGVLGSCACDREVYSPDSFDDTTPTPKRANTIGKMSPRSWGPRRPPFLIRWSSSSNGLASAAYSDPGRCSMAASKSPISSAIADLC